MDHRLQALRSWIDGILSASSYELEPATGDASFRRYFRVRAGERSYIAMDAPPDRYDGRVYRRIAERMLQLGLNVPRILAGDLERGFFLISDLGERLYLAYLNEASVERLYADAMSALRVLQQGICADGLLPDYDRALLSSEMELFREWYLGRHLGRRLTAAQHETLGQSFVLLAEAALAQPRVWIHRDFHSRNLLLTDENNPGIVDFQDALHGPVTYDLVSLLRDCYIGWPNERVIGWVEGYRASARRGGLPVAGGREQFLQWFDLMGVQRHLKAIGIFARLCHRDGKSGYLADIPRTLAYVLDVSARRRELSPLHRLLQELALPEAASAPAP